MDVMEVERRQESERPQCWASFLHFVSAAISRFRSSSPFRLQCDGGSMRQGGLPRGGLLIMTSTASEWERHKGDTGTTG